MPDGQEPLTARTVDRIGAVDPDAWDSCAGPNNPFVSHAFLSALEDSGSASAEEGWMPQHMLIEDAAGRLVGCSPLYLKSHSYGEYVFDHAWADAFERAGGTYYPKAQCAVPFTPATGPRLLVRPDADTGQVRDGLLSAMIQLVERLGLSSLHITFATETEWRRGGEIGLLQRLGEQFHWHNDGYDSFDDFLAALNSRKRKAIRRERRQAAESGLTIRPVTGGDLRTEHWDAFFAFYQNTSDRKWGWPYLTREFFDLLHERMAERVVLFLAEDGDKPVAGALNLLGSDALYGRNWGAEKRVPFLHFETCYYQAIDYAIGHGLKRVEAGAQGPHKIQRGYVPVRTYSMHHVANPSLRRAVADYLEHERRAVDREIAAFGAHSPYRQSNDTSG